MEMTHKLFSRLFSHGEREIDEASSVCKPSEEDCGSKLGFTEFSRVMACGGKDIKLYRDNMLKMFSHSFYGFLRRGNQNEILLNPALNEEKI